MTNLQEVVCSDNQMTNLQVVVCSDKLTTNHQEVYLLHQLVVSLVNLNKTHHHLEVVYLASKAKALLPRVRDL